jgi:hypothetical protein
MKPNNIQISNLSKSFEYIKFSNQIDNIENIDDIRTLAKCYFKLYLKQQEIVSDWAIPQS